MTNDSAESTRRMIQSMLELTNEDEGDNLTPAARMELLKMKLDSDADLSAEQELLTQIGSRV